MSTTVTAGPASQFKTTVHNDWCPGCGDFGILTALQMALSGMALEPHRVAVFSGIGCSGKTPHYVNAYGVHTLHGRVLPFALGAKLANPDLKIVIVGGDGDGMGIGAGHFVNSARRNANLTYILFNNGVYGLTKGQASPTLKLGTQTKSLPQPNINEGVNPLLLALASGYTFIGRGYSYDGKHLVKLIQQGIEHKGFSFIDVLQPCPTYNDINTKEWFSGDDRPDSHGKPDPRVYKVNDNGYDPLVTPEMTDDQIGERLAVFVNKALEWGDRIPIGVLLQNERLDTYEERISHRIKNYFKKTPVTRKVAEPNGAPTSDITPFFQELRVT
ncbi:MAG: thiamine pyrophosphate-dependent enzyme [bacterium]